MLKKYMLIAMLALLGTKEVEASKAVKVLSFVGGAAGTAA
ncbi:MAG: hypothetical protein UR26_C0002G0227 [candidate division TM6 bacterium GW2011_GWF2_32_72]|nr:MAG: hypothetical protein UR26_C0002G0227 [candidate division TM6 bacterium GW2011_GWF2_32_72]